MDARIQNIARRRPSCGYCKWNTTRRKSLYLFTTLLHVWHEAHFQKPDTVVTVCDQSVASSPGFALQDHTIWLLNGSDFGGLVDIGL